MQKDKRVSPQTTHEIMTGQESTCADCLFSAVLVLVHAKQHGTDVKFPFSASMVHSADFCS